MLRAHLGAAFNNDGAALAAAFPPYSTFGADYSAPSAHYISNTSKNHGYSGSFVRTVFEATKEGREALDAMQSLLNLPPPPLAALGMPYSTMMMSYGSTSMTSCSARLRPREHWISQRGWPTSPLRLDSFSDQSPAPALMLCAPLHHFRPLLLAIRLHDAPSEREAAAAD